MSATTTSVTSLRSKLERIVRPHLKLLPADSALDPDANLGNLGLDSMASINLLFDLETELKVSIPDERIDENTFETLGSLETLVADLA